MDAKVEYDILYDSLNFCGGKFYDDNDFNMNNNTKRCAKIVRRIKKHIGKEDCYKDDIQTILSLLDIKL